MDGIDGARADLFVGAAWVLTPSTVTGEGLDRLRALNVGRTVVLLGASGAGKSTLTNVLLGDETMETGEVGRTGEGRHTTTRRELLPLPGGGAIIDTPGIRAATAWDDGEEEDEAPESDDEDAADAAGTLAPAPLRLSVR